MVFANPKYLQRSERGTFRDFTRYHLGGNSCSGTAVAALRSRVAPPCGRRRRGVSGWSDPVLFALRRRLTAGATLRDNKREGANNFGVFVQDMLLDRRSRGCSSLGARYDDITYHSQASSIRPSTGSKAFRADARSWASPAGLSPPGPCTRTSAAGRGAGRERDGPRRHVRTGHDLRDQPAPRPHPVHHVRGWYRVMCRLDPRARVLT